MNSPRWARLVFATTLCTASHACSTPAESAATDAGHDVIIDARGDVPKVVSDSGVDSRHWDPVQENETTGLACTSDADCDKGALIENICTENAFSGNSLNPTPVCIAVDCEPGDLTKALSCDGDRGVCLSTGSGGICFPRCEFADSAAEPTGCVGKNKCNVFGWSKNEGSGEISGVGYCFGGCRVDDDCPTGNKCQVEDGFCMKTVVTYTKAPGTACTDADAKAPAKCNCLYTTADKAGYCANVCYFGEMMCEAGFTCDIGLPKTAVRDGDTVFTAAPKGLAGYCLKDCASDADCAGLNAYCDETAGTGRKTCQVGKRPCVRNEQCPSPQTCVGVTADSYGRCQ